MSAIVIAMASLELSLLAAGTAQDGPTPLRNIPSVRLKAAICRPKKPSEHDRTLYAGTLPIKEILVSFAVVRVRSLLQSSATQ